MSIDLDAIPKKLELSETDAIDMLSAALRGDESSPSAAAAPAFIQTPEAIRAVWAAAAAGTVTEDLQVAFHREWTVRGHRIREAVNDDEAMARILRRILPPYEGHPLTVYRGEQAARAERGEVGFNWAADRKVAEMFASGLCTLCPGGGVLLQAMAPVEALISGPSAHSAHLGENELVVDPSRLNGITTLARYPGAGS